MKNFLSGISQYLLKRLHNFWRLVTSVFLFNRLTFVPMVIFLFEKVISVWEEWIDGSKNGAIHLIRLIVRMSVWLPKWFEHESSQEYARKLVFIYMKLISLIDRLLNRRMLILLIVDFVLFRARSSYIFSSFWSRYDLKYQCMV